MSETEMLEVGNRRPATSWRRRLALLVVVLAVGVTAYVVDRELREREERAVARCEKRANTALSTAGAEVRAAYEYVRPSLINPTPEFQDAARRWISRTAEGADVPLQAPYEVCRQVSVFPLHDDLQARRDRCVEVLQAQRTGLVAVAADGGELGEWLGTPRAC